MVSVICKFLLTHLLYRLKEIRAFHQKLLKEYGCQAKTSFAFLRIQQILMLILTYDEEEIITDQFKYADQNCASIFLE